LEISWGQRDGAVVLRVRGLPGAAADPQVYPAEVLDGRRPARHQPMAGRWDAADDEATFVPRFPFLPDTAYALVVGDGQRVGTLRTPPVPGPRLTTVVAVEPALAVVPRNLLRFAVTFSAPMSEGRAARFLRLEDAAGSVVPGALLSLDPELWDAGHRRLTVLLDPARIKRGLAPHREAGYPLTEGGQVRLVVDEGYPDAEGRGLRSGAAAAFSVGPDLRGRVRPEAWRLAAPAAGTRQPLDIRFDRPLDRLLADRCLRVAGIRGAGAARPDGLGWSFRPDAPWPPGTVSVVVDPALEDVAGNSVARVFDRDLAVADDDPLGTGVVLTVDLADVTRW
jgi:hypothetical protein